MVSPTDSPSGPTRSNAARIDWNYPGRELESMVFAVNYHRWILQRLKPFLGRRIIEVGAGTGSLYELLLETRPESLMLLEPSANMFPRLVERLHDIDNDRVAQAHRCTLADARTRFRGAMRPDSIVYVNVLEHIENDEEELRTVHSVLPAGGCVLIFVPANQWLMGSIDRQFGHFRRYGLEELRRKCRSTGFAIRFSSHFDALGIIPWLLRYRVFQSDHMEPRAVRFYDRYVVPIAQAMERVIAPPIGKNIIVIGEKVQ